MALGGSAFCGVDPAGGGVQSFPVADLYFAFRSSNICTSSMTVPYKGKNPWLLLMNSHYVHTTTALEYLFLANV
jgi:hypothetical protein